MQTVSRISALAYVLLVFSLGGCEYSPTSNSAVFASDMPSKKTSSNTERAEPTIVDFWDGNAQFVTVSSETGLPMGESDTLLVGTTDDGFYSYIHASHQSAGVLDQCGAPVPFPGCVILLQSLQINSPFAIISQSEGVPSCLIPCTSCPCDSVRDHIDQQQYPRVVRQSDSRGERWWMVYEYRATIFLRRSGDGVLWGPPEEVPLTGVWGSWLMGCQPWERIGPHPFAVGEYDCLIGSPPGLFVDGETLYIFVGLGQNPGHMGCLYGPAAGPAANMRRCKSNPLFTGAIAYGPEDRKNASTNPYFNFRTISSADVFQIVEAGFGKRYYMLYEGVRGAGAGDPGDTQFALGLARSLTDQIDGPWERYADNPILIDQPGNVGVGHADLIVVNGRTVLFTSLDGQKRVRLELEWK